MGHTIPQRELRNQNTRVIDRVIAGDTFVITRNGAPVAELRSVTSDGRTFVSKSRLAAQGPHIDSIRFR